MISKRVLSVSALLASIILLPACTSYEPVSVKQCGKVVKHATKVLGALAPSRSKLLASCKKASDTQRGCFMAATIAGELSQCK